MVFHCFLGKDGEPQILKIRLIKCWESWIWDQDLSKTWHGYVESVKLWNLKTLELWEFKKWETETWKLSNSETLKLRNRETFSFKGIPHPSTFRLPPSAPAVRNVSTCNPPWETGVFHQFGCRSNGSDTMQPQRISTRLKNSQHSDEFLEFLIQ